MKLVEFVRSKMIISSTQLISRTFQRRFFRCSKEIFLKFYSFCSSFGNSMKNSCFSFLFSDFLPAFSSSLRCATFVALSPRKKNREKEIVQIDAENILSNRRANKKTIGFTLNFTEINQEKPNYAEVNGSFIFYYEQQRVVVLFPCTPVCSYYTNSMLNLTMSDESILNAIDASWFTDFHFSFYRTRWA